MNSFFKWLFYEKKGNIVLWLSIILSAAIACFCVKVLHFKLVGILPPCFLNAVFGIRCVGCGGTRCVQAMLGGDFKTAFYYNPLTVVAFAVCVVLFIKFIINSLKKNYTPPKVELKMWQGIALGVIVIAFMIVRNLPFYRAIFY